MRQSTEPVIQRLRESIGIIEEVAAQRRSHKMSDSRFIAVARELKELLSVLCAISKES